MRAVTVAVIAVLAVRTLARADPPAHQRFTLYKFQNRIGIEDSIDDGREVRAVFTFTDRTSPVPLASVLERGKDGAPVRFQIWGNTSRLFTVDDRVVVDGGKLTITQRGQTRSVAAPAQFFVGSAYAPVAMTQELLRYWASHGKPASLPVFPIGTISIERRGEDTVTDRDGKPRALERFAVGGLGWGKETVWLDDKQQVAALTGIDTEFDHFEATGREFGEALGVFVARAAEDGLQALAETSRGLRVDGGDGTEIVAYVHARLIDGTGAPPVADAVVVIDGGKITAAGPSSKVSVPAGARTVDAAGATLVPGLWDMHAHFEQVEWGPVYLAAGVTTVRDCGNELDFVRAVRDTIDAGKGVGPRVLLACIVDGEGPGSLGTERLTRSEDIPALIKKFKAAGCAQVKIYQSLDPRLIRPLAAAAHAAGLTVTGHVPTGATAVQAVTDGYDQINHLQFVMRAFADAGPGPDDDFARRWHDKSVALIGLLHKAGVPIVAGTDQAVPGHSLHREIELYVEAGFTPMEALQAATIVPARAMKKDKELGTVEAGKRADFLLIDGDPLADIHALRKIRVVVAGGRAYDPAALWRSVGFTP